MVGCRTGGLSGLGGHRAIFNGRSSGALEIKRLEIDRDCDYRPSSSERDGGCAMCSGLMAIADAVWLGNEECWL